jgi:hypothetical protein
MTKIDKSIIEVFKKNPQQIIRVKFVFDTTNEVFANNLKVAENYFGKFSSIIHSRRKTDKLLVVDVTTQALLCETLSNECLSLTLITA